MLVLCDNQTDRDNRIEILSYIWKLYYRIIVIMSCHSNSGKIVILRRFCYFYRCLFDSITTTVVQGIYAWLTTSLLGSKLKSSQLIQLNITIFWYTSWMYVIIMIIAIHNCIIVIREFLLPHSPSPWLKISQTLHISRSY